MTSTGAIRRTAAQIRESAAAHVALVVAKSVCLCAGPLAIMMFRRSIREWIPPVHPDVFGAALVVLVLSSWALFSAVQRAIALALVRHGSLIGAVRIVRNRGVGPIATVSFVGKADPILSPLEIRPEMRA